MKLSFLCIFWVLIYNYSLETTAGVVRRQYKTSVLSKGKDVTKPSISKSVKTEPRQTNDPTDHSESYPRILNGFKRLVSVYNDTNTLTGKPDLDLNNFMFDLISSKVKVESEYGDDSSENEVFNSFDLEYNPEIGTETNSNTDQKTKIASSHLLAEKALQFLETLKPISDSDVTIENEVSTELPDNTVTESNEPPMKEKTFSKKKVLNHKINQYIEKSNSQSNKSNSKILQFLITPEFPSEVIKNDMSNPVTPQAKVDNGEDEGRFLDTTEGVKVVNEPTKNDSNIKTTQQTMTSEVLPTDSSVASTTEVIDSKVIKHNCLTSKVNEVEKDSDCVNVSSATNQKKNYFNLNTVKPKISRNNSLAGETKIDDSEANSTAKTNQIKRATHWFYTFLESVLGTFVIVLSIINLYYCCRQLNIVLRNTRYFTRRYHVTSDNQIELTEAPIAQPTSLQENAEGEDEFSGCHEFVRSYTV